MFYIAQLLLEQGGEVVAGAGRQIFVTEGGIADLAAPDTLMPGQTGTFTVTFQNSPLTLPLPSPA